MDAAPHDELPSDADRRFRAAFAHFASGDFEGAITALEALLDDDPAHVAALRTVAMACYHRGEHEKALEYGRRHVAADPKDVMAHSSLSLFLMKNGRIQEAEEVAAKAKILTWKQQLKEGVPGSGAGLAVLDDRPAVVESAPIMPMMPTMPTMPKKPALPAKPPDGALRGDGEPD
jgi:tetratricopeptide (TPR) repeat protein